jgi:hypothetical protein
MAKIKILIAMPAKNFELELVDDAPPVKELFTFTMTPSALRVLLRPRVECKNARRARTAVAALIYQAR